MPAVGGRGVGRKAERGGRLTHADAVGAPVKGWAAAALPEWWPAPGFLEPARRSVGRQRKTAGGIMRGDIDSA